MKKLFFTLLLLALCATINAQKDMSFDVQKGIEFYDKGNYKEAFAIFSNAANKNNAYAQCLLG